MTLTVDYLKQLQSDFRTQADRHYADWQATLGAIELLDHLVSVAKEGDAPVSDGIEIGHLFATKDEPHAD
jgi:hypothetical protein